MKLLFPCVDFIKASIQRVVKSLDHDTKFLQEIGVKLNQNSIFAVPKISIGAFINYYYRIIHDELPLLITHYTLNIKHLYIIPTFLY